jgi:citrate lyase subunit beta/citryl-CoA lyase
MLRKGLASGADAAFIDLEDSVPEHQKEQARRKAIQAAPLSPPGAVLGLRVNSWRTKWCYRDIVEVVETAGEYFDYIVLPKVESAVEVAAVSGLLEQIEQSLALPHQILIEPCIESGVGLLNSAAIASATPRVFSLMFAPEGIDFSSDLRFSTGVSSQYVEATVVIPAAAARAARVQLIDGPYFQVHDRSGLRASALARFRMGFDGKWAVHPDQIDVINEAFSPPSNALDEAVATMEAYERVSKAGVGAALLGDTMIDEASRKRARALLDRSTQLSWSRSEDSTG